MDKKIICICTILLLILCVSIAGAQGNTVTVECEQVNRVDVFQKEQSESVYARVKISCSEDMKVKGFACLSEVSLKNDALALNAETGCDYLFHIEIPKEFHYEVITLIVEDEAGELCEVRQLLLTVNDEEISFKWL